MTRKFFALFFAALCLTAPIFGDQTLWKVSDPPVVQTTVDGQIVDRYGPTWLLRSAPDLLGDRALQAGNDAPRQKIMPKTSSEIGSNFIGVNSTRMPRSRWGDEQPLEAVHLIDGDAQTCWMSRGQYHPDDAPVWIRLDFPAARTIVKVVFVQRPIQKPRPAYSYPVIPGGVEVGRGLPVTVKIEGALDGHTWTTLYDGPLDASNERVEIPFDATRAKQLRVTAGDLVLCETMYAASFAELEALDSDGNNAALVSTGTGITASTTDHGPGLEIEQHRWLWPIQPALGAKWLRIGYHDDPINWHHVEKQKGVLAVDPVADAAITEMADSGMNIVMCLDFGNRLYSGPFERTLPQMWEWYWDLPAPPTTPEALAAWDRYVEFMVEKYKDRVHYFELWNEWDITLYWGETVSLDNYLNIAKRTAAIVRRIAPDAKLLSGSISGGGFPFGCRDWSETDWSKNAETNIYLKMFRELAPLVDVIGWHPYYNPDPISLDTYPEDVRALKAWLASIGFTGECMSTEWNVTQRDRPLADADRGKFFAGSVQLSEMQKAKFVSRLYLQDAGLGLASFFCEIYNPYHAADLSLLRRTVDSDPVSSLQPQAAFYAVRNIAGYTDQFTSEAFDVSGLDTAAYRVMTFQTPSGRAAAIWKKGALAENSVAEPVDVAVDFCAMNAQAFDPINGVAQPLILDVQDGKTVIRGLMASDSPLLIAWKNITQPNPAAIPQERNVPRFIDQTLWMNALVRNETAFPIDLMFVGDSITEGWEGAGREVWKNYFGNRRAWNFGISGDTTKHVLWRLENTPLEKIAPKMVVVLIGTNNGDTPLETAGGIETIVRLLEEKFPAAKILLLDVFPRGETPDDPARIRIEAINANLANRFDADERVVRMNLADQFLAADGTLSADLMPDFLHPNAEGYRRWAEAMEPEIEKFLGPLPADPPEAVGYPRELGRFEEKNERLKKGDVDVLMIGDSITHYWETDALDVWNGLFDTKTAINLGTGWDRTENVVWRLEHYDFSSVHPSKAFLLIGVNNSGSSEPEKIGRGNRKICEILHEKFPQMTIYVQKVFPWGQGDKNGKNAKREQINAAIENALGDLSYVTVLDLSPLFLTPDGKLDLSVMMPDLIHLNVDGYRRWAEFLSPYVNE